MKPLAAAKSQAMQWYLRQRSWKTDRKLLVIESDDWGAIRIPPGVDTEKLRKAGIALGESPYDRLDCLENREDLELLFEILDKAVGAGRSSPVMTFNTVMGNPDFDAIEKSGFEQFFHEHFHDSYNTYHSQDLRGIWRQAVEASLIVPQFHGREHLNSQLWMRDLKAGIAATRDAFKHRIFALSLQTSSPHQQHYSAACSVESNQELETFTGILDDGLSMFESTFGASSRTFVACNYVLPREVEAHLANRGVSGIQTQRGYVQPQPKKSGKRRRVYRYTGQRNRHGQLYTVRNVLFEPYLDADRDWTASSIREIDAAFQSGLPAIVCTHRINYVGSHSTRHRDRSLRLLERLLESIMSKWPDIEFCSSDQLCSIIDADRPPVSH